MSGPTAGQVLMDQVEAAVVCGATTLDEVVARTRRGRTACAEALTLLVDLGELASVKWGRRRIYARSKAEAERLLAERTPKPRPARAPKVVVVKAAPAPRVVPIDADSVAGEFIVTRRARWARKLEELGVPAHRARVLVAPLETSAAWRAVRESFVGDERRAA